MKAGLHLTDRDLLVFKYLAFGPAFEEDLHSRFFITGGKRILRAVFLRRLKRVVNSGFLFRHLPKWALVKDSRSQAIYVLAKAGVELLNNEHLLPSSRIREVKIDIRTIYHEVMLTRLIRKIYDGEPRRYTVTRMLDHFDLAKLLQKVRSKRIPDLKFTVKTTNGSYFSFIVEIDAGSTHMPEMMQKLKTFIRLTPLFGPKNITEYLVILIVCNTTQRRLELQRAVMESRLLDLLKFKFLFSSIYEIDNHLGLYNPWYRADGKKIEVIFKGG